MAIINPKPSDFINAQKRALDYQQYRSTSDILHAVAQFYKVSVFRTTDDKPLYHITSGLDTSVNVTDDKIQITVIKGSAIVDNQPIVFLDDFIFEFDKPSINTSYYVYLQYKYVEEYPPNYATIEIYTNPVDSDGYFLLSQVEYQADTDEATVQDFTIEDKTDLFDCSNCAPKTGDSTQTFKVADAIEDYDAVNKRQLLEVKEESENSDIILTARANEIESSLIDLKETVSNFPEADNIADTSLSNVDDNVILEKIKNVDGEGSGLDADTVDGVQGALLGIGGEGYSWKDKTSERALNTVYTNTTGAPIQLAVTLDGPNSSRLGAYIYINGVKLGEILGENANNNSEAQILSLIIPDGFTYEIRNHEDTIIISWFELTK